MRYARHFPTMRFSQEQFLAMPLGRKDELAPDGFSVWFDRAGKAVVTYFPPDSPYVSGQGISGSFCVRPIIAVPAGRAA